MRVFLFLLVSLPQLALSNEHIESAEAQKQSDCVTHTVTNTATNVTNTITRCRSESVGSFAHKQPEPKEAHSDDSIKTDWFWKRSEIVSDFDAQVSMADSTYFIMLLSFGSLIISAAGLFYLIRTVHQNRATFEHIKSSTELELRPYLDIKVKKVFCSREAPSSCIEVHEMGETRPIVDTKETYINFTMELINRGKTPAREFAAFEPKSLKISIFNMPAFETHKENRFELGQNPLLSPRYIAPGDKKDYRISVPVMCTEAFRKHFFFAIQSDNTRACVCDISGIMRYKDDFTLIGQRHHAMKISLNCTLGSVCLNNTATPTSEATIADANHYDNYEELIKQAT